MGLEYIFPRVSINESNTGPRPAQGVSMSTIGLVGTFCKGPLNTAVTIGSLEKLVDVFGGDKAGLTGYKSAISAFLQGATDLKVVRVGASTIAKATYALKNASNADVVTITALTNGTWGNDIKVSVVAGTGANTFKLIVLYGIKTEEFDNLTLANLTNVVSRYVTATKVEGATLLPANISATSLTGGNDGATTADADYVGTITSGVRSGLKVLETVNANIIIAAQQNTTAIQNALIAHCANMTPVYGLRVAVLNGANDLLPDGAATITASIDNARGIFAYPWVEISELTGQYIAPDGLYAGRLATLNSNQSPSNKVINGVVSLKTYLSDAELKTLTLAKVSPIGLEEGRGYRIRNGVNLSSDPAWSQTSLRRVFDEIEMSIFNGVQWAKSEDNTPSLRESIATQIDGLLDIFRQQKKIYDFKPTVCDSTNNTPESIAARILNIRVRVRPNYAADFIDISIERLLGSESN